MVGMVSAVTGENWYLQVCKQGVSPWPECQSVKVGKGLELVDGEISIIPVSNGEVVTIKYLIFNEVDVRTNRVQELDEVKEEDIITATWGDKLLMKVGPTQTESCSGCWSVANGKFVMGKMNAPDGVYKAIVITYLGRAKQ